jgi:hypothetical protein
MDKPMKSKMILFKNIQTKHFSQLIFFYFKALPCSLNSKLCSGHGICKNDNKGGYACKCKTGFMGRNCQIGTKKKVFSHSER